MFRNHYYKNQGIFLSHYRKKGRWVFEYRHTLRRSATLTADCQDSHFVRSKKEVDTKTKGKNKKRIGNRNKITI